ncbi:MAG: DMT family transporter [Silicimonas sp.]|nr:DMT family transporter [Silicimonas sp.]
MGSDVFLIVLFAAFLHALWNAIVKGAGDRSVILGLVAAGHVVPGLFMAVHYGAPAMAALPYVIGTTVVHWGYYWLLNLAYRTGDLSIVYPVARGFAPVLIAIGAMVFANEMLPLTAWLGILAVSFGILLLARRAVTGTVAKTGLVAAIGVAVTIATYSIIDGIGVRVSGNPGGYIGWIFTAEIFVVLYIFLTRWGRLCAMPARSIAIGIFGGIVSSAAYGLVLYAKVSAPLGMVSALRETSVIFAALIGVMWFGEGPRRDRLIGAAIVALGIGAIAATRV